MKNKILSAIVVFFVATGAAFSQQRVQPINYTALDAYFEKAMKDYQVPGMAIGIIYNDTVRLSKGYGLADVTTGAKVDENTVFCVASNTKAMTAACLAMLVDEKKITWEDKVTRHLPFFASYDPFVTSQFTVRDLLCHRSGLATFSGDLLWYGTTHSREEVIKRSRMLKPVYGFREHFGYSNIHYLAAGQIIPAVTGTSWDNFIRERLLNKLDMKNTLISTGEIPGRKNVAQPHNLVNDKLVTIPFVNWDNIAPAGAVISSANDMLKWLRLQLNMGEVGGQKFYSRERALEMWEANTPQSTSPFMKSAMPSRHFTAYALGWEVFDYAGYKVVNHGGGYDGFISKTIMIPELKFGMVILTNSNNSLPTALAMQGIETLLSSEPKDWAGKLLERIKKGEQMEKEAAAKEEAARKKDTKPSLPLRSFEGTFGGDMYGDATISLKNGKLYLKMLPTSIFEGTLEHWQNDVFTISFPQVPSLPKGKVTFKTTGDKVTSFIIDIPNPDFDFTELDFTRRQ